MYTKLFSEILTSSVWVKPLPTKIIWITLLAMADKNGEVMGSIPGIAQLAGVSVKECEEALETLLEPDQYSRTPDDEGRRLEQIDGGWCILNYRKYAQKANDEDRKRKDAERQKRFRDRKKRNATVTESNAPVTENGKNTVTKGQCHAKSNARIHTQTETPDRDSRQQTVNVDSDSEVQTENQKENTTTTSTEKSYEYSQGSDISAIDEPSKIDESAQKVVEVADSKISLGSFLKIAEKINIDLGFAEAIWIDREEAYWLDAEGSNIVSPALFLKSVWDAAQAKQERNKGDSEREAWKIETDITRITKEIQTLQDNPASRNACLGFTKGQGDHFEQYESAWLEQVAKIYDEAVEKLPAEIAELEVLIEENRKGIEGEAAIEAFNDPGYRLALYAESFDSAPDFEEWDKNFNKPNTWRDPKGLTPTALVELRALKQNKTKLEAELSRAIRES